MEQKNGGLTWINDQKGNNVVESKDQFEEQLKDLANNTSSDGQTAITNIFNSPYVRKEVSQQSQHLTTFIKNLNTLLNSCIPANRHQQNAVKALFACSKNGEELALSNPYIFTEFTLGLDYAQSLKVAGSEAGMNLLKAAPDLFHKIIEQKLPEDNKEASQQALVNFYESETGEKFGNLISEQLYGKDSRILQKESKNNTQEDLLEVGNIDENNGPIQMNQSQQFQSKSKYNNNDDKIPNESAASQIQALKASSLVQQKDNHKEK